MINSTNYNLDNYTTISTIKEWKAIPTEVPIYETKLVSQICYKIDNSTSPITNTSYDCSYNQTIQNGTKSLLLVGWKPTKSQMFKFETSVKSNYGNINIPVYDSKVKVDEYNQTETINGTKTFIVEWNTPITKTNNGYGSSGLIAFIDEISGDIYHPWWNTTWTYKSPILINNTGNATVLTNYQVFLNVTYDSDMQAEFKDIRVVNDTSGAAVPYWIESKVNSSYANIWFNASNVPASVWTNSTYYLYYGNAAVSDGGSGNNTFIQYHGAASANYVDAAIVSIPFIYETKSRITSAPTSRMEFGVSSTQAGTTNSIHYVLQTNDRTYYENYASGVSTNTGTLPIWTQNQWYRVKAVAKSSTAVDYYGYDTTTLSATVGGVPTAAMGLTLNLPSATGEQEFSFVRKYIAIEPTATLGTEEIPPSAEPAQVQVIWWD